MVLFPLSPEGIPTDDPDLCWLWTGSRGSDRRYGQIREDGHGRLLKAHRVSYLIVHGDIPDRWDVCHACDTTLCVNPNHLFAAPHRANMWDYIGKYGGICRPKSPISLDQLRLFRARGVEPYPDPAAGFEDGECEVA